MDSKNINFIEEILTNINSLRAEDVIESMAEIYNIPIDREDLVKYPQFIQDIIFIIDYDTELSMNGILGFLKNSTNKYLPQTITALKNIGADTDVEVLKKISSFDTYKNINDIESLSEKIYLYNDFDIWKLLEEYVKREIKNMA
ncbi:Uncharacterised protein [[Clostridium] sordellii]|uniref:DMP19 family protein n=1 Tax=Paraclostridium sordellii TaxID=1505 RepID=UPI0005E009AD|nr:hypothetical protein [Paeniclostridium sordellii]CEP46542.1 Uncharacterised protein [[Clostridium] sordellii] [Paeniclostridium sordellii]